MAPMSITNHGHGAMFVDETGSGVESWLIDWQSLVDPPPSMKSTKRNTGVLVEFGEFARTLKLLVEHR